MRIFTIHRVLNVQYWQTVEKLHHRYRNALEHRYEKMHRQLAVIVFALTLVALAPIFVVNIHVHDLGDETLMTYGVVILGIIGLCISVSLWSLKARHEQTLHDLGHNPETESGLMSESNPIFRYIMSRDLAVSLERRNPNITELTRATFLKYLVGARGAYYSYLAMRKQLGTTSAAAIDAEYQCNLRLIELAETALKKIDPQFHIKHVDHCAERRAAALAKRDEELRALRVQQETEARHSISL